MLRQNWWIPSWLISQCDASDPSARLHPQWPFCALSRAATPAARSSSSTARQTAFNTHTGGQTMAFALKPEDFYHTGIIVPDLDAAMARLTALAGNRWITPLTCVPPFRTTPGAPEVSSTFLSSLESPPLELIKEVPASPWAAAPGNSIHHL